eukprot:TRINITY_DN12481_c0_g1_i1.p1 TRINITY_DN12481_c0_g1~~TRINITY_DN12481_c0_g1_i1.p1  ORF type:complete len:2107 (+),score=602.18 TRINITY_DN12481_c0_g1_i1:158-6478(+)
MGQGESSAGRLSKKGQIAPVGPAPASVTYTGGGWLSGPALPVDVMVPVVGKQYPTYLYTTVIASYPTAVAAVALIVPIALCFSALFTKDLSDYDLSLSGFEISDHATVMRRDVTKIATQDWQQVREKFIFLSSTDVFSWREAQARQENSGLNPRSVPWYRIYIQYKAKSPEMDKAFSEQKCSVLQSSQDVFAEYNLLENEDVLQFIQRLEERIVRLPGWRRVCFTSNRAAMRENRAWPSCVPITSIAQYFFPGSVRWREYGLDFRWKYFWDFTPESTPTPDADGSPTIQKPINSVLSTFYQNPHWRWYTDQRNDVNVRQSALLRSQINIGRPLEGLTQAQSDREVRRFLRYVMAFLGPIARDTWEGTPSPGGPTILGRWGAPKHVQVSFGGDGMVETMVEDAVYSDWWFTVLAVVILALSFWIYTHSFFIAVAAMAQTQLTYFSSAYIYLSAYDSKSSLLSLLGFFIILAMSCDGVAVFFNTFRQTAFMCTTGRRNTLNVPQRLAFCFRKAGAGIATSHLVAGIAFACTTVSPVPAVRRFGVFMFILVCVNSYHFMTFFPCVLIWHHFHVSKRRRNFQRQKEILLRRGHGRRPAVMCDAVKEWDTLRPTGPQFRRNQEAMWSPPPDLQTEHVVVSGEGRNALVAAFMNNFAHVGMRMGKKPPERRKADSELAKVKELEAEFDRLERGGAAGLAASRRRQPPQNVLRVPRPLTCMRDDGDVAGNEQVLRSLLAAGSDPVRPAEAGAPEAVRMLSSARDSEDDYEAHHRPFWVEVGHAVGIATRYGPGVFEDPQTRQPLDAALRLPQVAQTLRESLSDGPLRVIAVVLPPGGIEQVRGGPPRSPDNAAGGTPLGDGGGAMSGGEGGELLHGGAAVQRPSFNRPSTPDYQVGQCGPCCARAEQWWIERGQQRRRFGRFGKRVGETRDEKDRRILGKRVKHEGFTFVERAFYNYYAPLIRRTHWGILLVYFVLWVVFLSVYARVLQPSTDPPRLLEDSQQEEFEAVQRLFPVQGPCDFCGAYFRPFEDFPPPFGKGSGPGIEAGPSLSAPSPPLGMREELKRLEQCQYQMHQIMDLCGVCGGKGECVDCMGQPSKCTTTSSSLCLAKGCKWVDGVCRDLPIKCQPRPGRENAHYLPGWEIDKCGVCVHPESNAQNVWISRDAVTCEEVANPRRDHCMSCELRWPPTGQCQPCYLAERQRNDERDPSRRLPESQLEQWKYFYPPPLDGTPGDYCHTMCSEEREGNCDPSRGRCSPFTGECICHSSYQAGFYANADEQQLRPRCTVCLPGFYPLPEELAANPGRYPSGTIPCTMECDSVDDVSALDCKCRCTERPGFQDAGNWCPFGDAGKRGTRCSVCNRNGSAVVRDGLEDAPGWHAVSAPKPGAVAVGYGCQSKWRSQCDHGSMDPATGQCICDENYDDKEYGGTCAVAVPCGFHGVLDEDSGLCRCYACWTGPNCLESRCRNGGVCEDLRTGADPWSWRCNCVGSWLGDSCTECPRSCMAHGNCPLHWPEDFYDNPELGLKEEKYTKCWGCRGNWHGDLCERCVAPAGVPAFLKTRAEGECNEDGLIVGCDGMPASDAPGSYKWMVNCSGRLMCVGGGTTNTSAAVMDRLMMASCVGCDGVPGSQKVLDRCGVCGGYNECDCEGEEFAKEKARIELVWGLVPQNIEGNRARLWALSTLDEENGLLRIMDPHAASASYPVDEGFLMSDVETQRHLLWVCDQLAGRSDHIDAEQSECWLHDFQDYLNSHVLVLLQGAPGGPLQRHEVRPCRSYGCIDLPDRASDEVLVRLSFPWYEREEGEFDWILYQFSEARQKYDFIGFNTANHNNPEMRTQWVRMRFTLRMDADVSTDRAMRYYEYWQVIVKKINRPSFRRPGEMLRIGVCFQWSQTWVDMFHKLQAVKGTTYAIGMSGGAYLFIILMFTCSPTLTFLSAVVISGIVIFVISSMKIAEWELGPAEQVGLACLMGMAIEYTVHISAGFLEYLHAVQSTMLARDTTREQALAGTLQRTGVPIGVSATAMTVASLVLFACKVTVYRRIAEIMVMNILFSALHGLVIFPALLMAMGPTCVHRTIYARTMLFGISGGCASFILVVLYLSDSATGPTGEPLFE